MNVELRNKTAVITGGGSGIGLAITAAFHAAGARIYVLELRGEDAEAAFAKAGLTDRVTVLPCDVSVQKDVHDAVGRISGHINVLVNNAGIAHIGNAENTSEADFDRLVQVNVKGVYNCLHAVLPRMKAAGGGAIVNMASIAGSLGLPDRFAYSMTKGSVLAMTLSVAKDFIAHGIRCNSISPARVHTPFIDGYLERNYPGREAEMFTKLEKTQPIGRMGKPEEIAALALFLASDQAGFITGTDYPIDGGFVKLGGG